jgi:hypothetical protein
VNKLEAIVVREIFDGYLRERSPIRVIEELRAKGRTPKRYMTKAGTVGGAGAWSVTTVLRVLRNPLYIGKIAVAGETYDGEHDAIVDAEKFEQVRAVLGGRRPVTTKSVQRGYLLRGVLRCGACGSAMTPASAYKGRREYRYYRCTKRDREGSEACPTRPVTAQAVEAFVIERLRKIAADEKLVARVTSAIEARVTATQDKLEKERRELPREVGRLSAETKSLVSSLGEMSEAGRKAVSKRLDQVAQSMALAQERLREVEERLARLREVRADAAWTSETLASFDRLWDKLTDENRARIVTLLVERVVVNERLNALRIQLLDHAKGIDDAA